MLTLSQLIRLVWRQNALPMERVTATWTLWLDSSYPTDKDPEQPGVARGECDITSGVPADVESASPNAQVVFSNIKFGPIGSTFAQPT